MTPSSLAALSMLVLSASVAAPVTPIPLEAVRHVRELRGASPAPDGASIALVVAGETADAGRNHVWIATADGDAARPLRTGPQAAFDETDPQWSRDGSQVFERVSSPGVSRLARVGVRDGVAETLVLGSTAEQGSSHWSKDDGHEGATVLAYRLAPDGHTIAVVVDESRRTPAAPLRPPEDDSYLDRAKAAPSLRLLLISPSDGAVHETLSLTAPVQSLSWAEDSTRLLVVTGREDGAGLYGEASAVNASDGRSSALTGIEPTVSSAVWVGDQVGYLARCRASAPPECEELFAWDPVTRRSRPLSGAIEASITGTVLPGGDGRSVLALVAKGVAQRLIRFRLADGAMTPVSPDGDVVIAAEVRENGGALAVTVDKAAGRRAIVRSGPFAPWWAAASPPLRPSAWARATPHVITWTHEGLRLQGLVFMPPPSPDGPPPLVTWVHGGPYGAFQARSYNLADVLVSRGWAVFLPNPRGSLGRGASFARANRGDLGGKDLADILSGISSVTARFGMDPRRMAMIGYSYGGTMTAFAEGRTHVFRALVAGAPVIDQVSEYGDEEDAFDDRWYVGLPWKHLEKAWRQSPLSTAARGRTPLLILQGDQDDVDPPSQARELERALREAGVPVQLVRYPRETHASLASAFGLTSSREPWHSLDVAKRVTSFLGRAFAR